MNDAVKILSLLVISLSILLTGCNRTQMQVIADARADARALQSPRAADLTPEQRDLIAHALADNVLAATADLPGIPAPAMTSDEVLASPYKAGKAAHAAAANPPDNSLAVPGRAPIPDPLGNIFATIGAWEVRIGVVAVSAAALAIGLSFWPMVSAFLAPFRWLYEDALVVGSLLVVTGAGILWVGRHTWIVYALLSFLVAVIAIRFRAVWWPLLEHTFRFLCKAKRPDPFQYTPPVIVPAPIDTPGV